MSGSAPPDPATLPAGMDRFRDPDRYEPDEDLIAATRVAIMLRQPLLLTGDPGTGKSQLAVWLARRISRELIRFTAKSTTSAGDLLYRFDAVREFRESQRGGGADRRRYLTLRAFGRAVALTYPLASPEMEAAWDPEANRPAGAAVDRPPAPTASVVLVDEIDKAPRDVPNDLLVEFDTRAFVVPELDLRLEVQGGLDPIVVATSNSEKALPDAFLRRCVFHHIAMPQAERLEGILRRQLPEIRPNDPLLRDAIELFDALQGDRPELPLRKRPSVPELLGLVAAFAGLLPPGAAGLLPDTAAERRATLRRVGLRAGLRAMPPPVAAAVLTQLLDVMFKTRDDQEAARDWLRERWELPDSTARPAAATG